MDRGAWWATVHGVAKSWMPFTQYIMSDYQEKNYIFKQRGCDKYDINKTYRPYGPEFLKPGVLAKNAHVSLAICLGLDSPRNKL